VAYLRKDLCGCGKWWHRHAWTGFTL